MATAIPSSLRPSFKQAKELLVEQKNYSEARRVLASIPNAEAYAQFHTAMSQIASQEDDDELALAHIERAHSIAPDDILILARYAKLYIKLGKKQEALDCLEKAYSLGIKSKSAITLVSSLYSSLERYDRAQSLIEIGIDKNPNDPRLRRSMAVCLMKADNISGAESELDACLRMAPTNHSAIVMLAEIYITKGMNSKAISLLRSADNDNCPEKLHGRVMLNLAEALVHSGSVEKAKQELLRIKNKSGIRYNLTWGNLQSTEKNFDLALKSYSACFSTLYKDDQNAVTSQITQCTVANDMTTTCSNMRNAIEQKLKEIVNTRGSKPSSDSSSSDEDIMSFE